MHVHADHLTKTFLDATGLPIEALRAASFEVQPGERVALIGPSGSGKTTLLRMLNGTLQPTQGRLCFDSHCLPTMSAAELKRVRRAIATIYQQHYLVPTMPVYQNVLAGKLGRWSTARALLNLLYTRPADLAEAEAALARVHLSGKLYSRTADLSGGQQQRVAIARALVQDPAVLLADEPVASLDPALVEEVMALLVDLCEREGKTLIAALHQVPLTRRYFQRVIALREGTIVYDGTPEGLTDQRLESLYA